MRTAIGFLISCILVVSLGCDKKDAAVQTENKPSEAASVQSVSSSVPETASSEAVSSDASTKPEDNASDSVASAPLSDEELRVKMEALMSIAQTQSWEDAAVSLYKIRTWIEQLKEPTWVEIISNSWSLVKVEGNAGITENISKHVEWTTKQLEKVSDKELEDNPMVLVFGLAKFLDYVQLFDQGPEMVSPLLQQAIKRTENLKGFQEKNPMFLESAISLYWMDTLNELWRKNFDSAVQKLDIAESLIPKMDPELENTLSEDSPVDLDALEKELEGMKDSLSAEDYEETKEQIAEARKLQLETSNSSLSLDEGRIAAQFGLLRGIALHFSGKTEEAAELFKKGIDADFAYMNKAYSKSLYSILGAFDQDGYDISSLSYLRTDLENRLKDVFAIGLDITEVSKDSQGEKLGLKAGDKILKYNGWYVYDADGFYSSRWADVAMKKTGDVTLDVVVDGVPKTLQAKAGMLGVSLQRNEEKAANP